MLTRSSRTVRQRDDRYTHSDPFSGLPLCSSFKSSFDCIVALARKLRDFRGERPVLLVARSLPHNWTCDLYAHDIHLVPRIQSANARDGAAMGVFLDMAICNQSAVIAYVDHMQSQVGMGGGLSTLYEVLTRLRRDTTLDMPLRRLLNL